MFATLPSSGCPQESTSEEKHGKLLKRDSGDCRTFLCSVSEQLSEDSSIEVWETGGMGDWNRPRHLVLAVSSKIKVMCHSCIFIVFLIQCIPSHLQHNIIECMRGVYVLAKHSSLSRQSLCRSIATSMAGTVMAVPHLWQLKSGYGCCHHTVWPHNQTACYSLRPVM